MSDRRHVTPTFRHMGTHVMRTAVWFGIVAGLLALPVAVSPLRAQPRPAVRVAASVLERYVGQYVSPDGTGTFTVGVSGDTLFHETPEKRTPYRPLSESLFMLGPIFTAEFVLDPAGGATQILTDGVAFESRLRRKGAPPEEPAASSAAPAVRVPRSVLQRYVGIYEFIPGQMDRSDLRVVVALRGDTLIRHMNGGEQVLVPTSETRFRVSGTSLVTEFVVDDAGVTKVMGSGFQQLLARIPRKR